MAPPLDSSLDCSRDADSELMQSVLLLAETREWFAISKPSDLPFHSDAQGEGVVSLVKRLYSDAAYPVHRLDRVTSGVLLFGRTSEANSRLSTCFQERQANKYYLALSLKRPKKKQGWIKGDMVKARNGSFKLMRSHNNPAMTRFAACSIDWQGESAWLFLLKPITGKTHQLRVALKALGSPILGDERYGGGVHSRCYLHAWKLAISTPFDDINLEAPHGWGEGIDRAIPQLLDKIAGG